VYKREYGIEIVNQLGTARIKGGGFDLRVLIVNAASSLSYIQEVISRVQVTQTDIAWIFQRRIHKQTSVNFNCLVK
jgi:hypothetical protein